MPHQTFVQFFARDSLHPLQLMRPRLPAGRLPSVVAALQIVLTGGARAGRAGGNNDGGGCAKDPYMNAWIYYPGNPKGKRFVVDPVYGQSMPRLYHSVALVIPSGDLVSSGGDQGVAKGPITCDAPSLYGYKVDAFTFPANEAATKRGARGFITNAPAKVCIPKVKDRNTCTCSIAMCCEVHTQSCHPQGVSSLSDFRRNPMNVEFTSRDPAQWIQHPKPL
jgi:hypothetical protein